MTARPLGTLITVALTPPRRKHVLMHFKLRGQIGQPNVAVGRITETIRKYQGVKEFHMLARIGCYCWLI